MTLEKFQEKMTELKSEYNHFIEEEEFASACHVMDLMLDLKFNFEKEN